MQLLIDQLDVNSCAGEIEEYLARFSFWQDAHEDMSGKAAKGAFLSVIGGPAFSLVSTLVFPKTLQEATLQEIKDALLHHFKPVNFEASERAKFNTLSRSPSESIRSYVLQLQKQAATCNFGAELDNHLRDRLIAGINDVALQKRMLLEERPTFSSLRTLCEKCEELDKAVEQSAVLLHRCQNGTNRSKQVHTVSLPSSNPFKPKAPKSCFSCGGSHLRINCKFRNSKCYNCHKLGHISKVCRKSATMLTDAADQNKSLLTDFQSISLCTNSDEHVFETCKSLSGQKHSFVLDST